MDFLCDGIDAGCDSELNLVSWEATSNPGVLTDVSSELFSQTWWYAPEDGTLWVCAGRFPSEINFNGLNGEVRGLYGNDASILTATGDWWGGALKVDGGGTLTVTDIGFEDSLMPAVACTDATITMSDVRWTDNDPRVLDGTRCTGTLDRVVADRNGGGLLWRDGSVTVRDSLFYGNNGSGVSCGENAQVDLLGTVFESNWSAFGQIMSLDTACTVVVTDTDFIGNNTSNEGAAINFHNNWVEDAAVTVNGGSFVGNSSAYGGAIAIWRSSLVIDGAIFEDNVATMYGGAIYAISNGERAFDILNSVFRRNNAVDGGAVWARDGGLAVTGSDFEDNMAVAEGGAVWMREDGDIPIDDSRFVRNASGGDGGAIFMTDWTRLLDVTQSLFQDNEAGGDGGAIATDSRLSLVGTTLDRNAAIGESGAFTGRDVAVNNCIITNNTATTGGVFQQDIAPFTCLDSEISGNTAAVGGAIWFSSGTVYDPTSVISTNCDWDGAMNNAPDDIFHVALGSYDFGTGGAFLCNASGCL